MFSRTVGRNAQSMLRATRVSVHTALVLGKDGEGMEMELSQGRGGIVKTSVKSRSVAMGGKGWTWIQMCFGTAMGGSASAALRAERGVNVRQEHAGQVRLAREVIVPHMIRHPRGKEVIQPAAPCSIRGQRCGRMILDEKSECGGY